MWKIVVAACALLGGKTSSSPEAAGGASAAGSEAFWALEGRLYPTLPIAVPLSDDRRCRDDSDLLVRNLKNQTLWAMKMWDSSAKAPSGVLYGSIFQMGNFDECLKVVKPVKAQFCVAQVFAKIPDGYLNPENPFSLENDPSDNVWTNVRGSRIDPSKVPRDAINWGLCVPGSCSSSQLEKGINAYLDGINQRAARLNRTTYSVEIKKEFCTLADEYEEVSTGEIAFWLFTFVLIFLTVSSTITDYIREDRSDDSFYGMLWMCFSVKRNLPKLRGSSEAPRKESQMDVLHGIKALSIVFIVLGHRIGISLSVTALNFQNIEEHLRTESTLFFVHTDLVVDTFFFISGLLACFFLLNVFSVRFVNPLFAVLVRFLRLAPAYFYVIWYQASAASRLGFGPLWKAMAKEENRFCSENWWTNLLFINNYVKPKEMCMTHSWYIPCDFHFFILGICLVVLLVKHKKVGLVCLGALTIISAVIPAVVTYMNHIQPMIIFYHDFLSRPRDNESFYMLYIKSHNRATVYLIGMTMGYFLYSWKDSAKRISLKLTVSALLVWLLLMFAPMAYGSLYYDSERPYNGIEAAIFASARRISWAVGFSIFVLVNRFGNIPVLSKGLSSKPAFFLSNITYGIYLLHFNLISADVFQTRSPKPFLIKTVIMDGIGDLIYSGILAVILFLILEVPCKRIMREFLLPKQIQMNDKMNSKELQATNNNISRNYPAMAENTTTVSVKL